MKTFLLCTIAWSAVSVFAAAPPPIDTWESNSFSLLPNSFQRDPHLMVMINTEFTAAGRQAPQASLDHPVYYQVHDGGEVEEGASIAGERPPTSADLARVLHQTLASGGYRQEAPEHPATILIYYRWGSFNHLQALDDSGGPDAESATPTDDMEARNLIERAGLVGGTKFALKVARACHFGALTQLERGSIRDQFLLQQAFSNRYFVIATAYDLAAAAQQKKVPLWRTKISTDSRGIMMEESLPGLIAVAGPYFGHETDGPVRLNRTVISEGKVQIGAPIVKGVLPPEESAEGAALKPRKR
jgi:hypothetical protein